MAGVDIIFLISSTFILFRCTKKIRLELQSIELLIKKALWILKTHLRQDSGCTMNRLWRFVDRRLLSFIRSASQHHRKDCEFANLHADSKRKRQIIQITLHLVMSKHRECYLLTKKHLFIFMLIKFKDWSDQMQFFHNLKEVRLYCLLQLWSSVAFTCQTRSLTFIPETLLQPVLCWQSKLIASPF